VTFRFIGKGLLLLLQRQRGRAAQRAPHIALAVNIERCSRRGRDVYARRGAYPEVGKRKGLPRRAETRIHHSADQMAKEFSLLCAGLDVPVMKRLEVFECQFAEFDAGEAKIVSCNAPVVSPPVCTCPAARGSAFAPSLEGLGRKSDQARAVPSPS
jgi:hypothetical protein